MESGDYTNWSHEALLKRVADLETQLRERTDAESNRTASAASKQKSLPTQRSSSPPKQHKHPPRKPPKPFDPSKYHTRLIALKFAYLGANYNGFEHAAGNTTPLPTVEEMLWRALRKTKLIFPRFSGNQHDGTEARAGEREGTAQWNASVGWHPWNGEERKEEVCWDGCDYSKCGRTDRGVSAFGQVIGIRVRSSRPKITPRDVREGVEGQILDDGESRENGDGNGILAPVGGDESDTLESSPLWDSIRDELPYIDLLNRVLPPDIRILAWCPDLPSDFSARFNCRERRYRYFFTNPAYMPLPPSVGERAREGWLDLGAMQRAAKKLEGLHDFRNFCKIDASKQITNFERKVFRAGIHEVTQEGSREIVEADRGGGAELPRIARHDAAQLYFFEVRGSAFLWHQVRHMVGILFLVGQGYEDPRVVDELLDTTANPACPAYEMASDAPLVLWDCIFPDLSEAASYDHYDNGVESGHDSYDDAMEWIYAGDVDTDKKSDGSSTTLIVDGKSGKYGRNNIMDELWALWRERRIQEFLAGSLMDVVNRQGRTSQSDRASNGEVSVPELITLSQTSARVFDGSDIPSSVGKYVPLMRRKRKETADVLNARYAVRKGLHSNDLAEGDMDE